MVLYCVDDVQPLTATTKINIPKIPKIGILLCKKNSPRLYLFVRCNFIIIKFYQMKLLL